MMVKAVLKKFLRIKLRGETDIDKLVKRGLVVGKHLNMQQGVIIDSDHCWLIEIGSHVTLAPRVHVLAHDASTKLFLDYTRIASVKIGNYVFIGAGSIVLPGTTIGDRVIIGAGSVVTGTLEGNSVYAGNPARKIAALEDYLERKKAEMSEKNVYDESWTLRGGITEEQKKSMKECVNQGSGFVE